MTAVVKIITNEGPQTEKDGTVPYLFFFGSSTSFCRIQISLFQVRPAACLEHATSRTTPFTFTRLPFDGVRLPPRESTVISPVPSSTLYILKGTSGTPHELVTVPSTVTVRSEYAPAFCLTSAISGFRNVPAHAEARAKRDGAQPQQQLLNILRVREMGVEIALTLPFVPYNGPRRIVTSAECGDASACRSHSVYTARPQRN